MCVCVSVSCLCLCLCLCVPSFLLSLFLYIHDTCASRCRREGGRSVSTQLSLKRTEPFSKRTSPSTKVPFLNFISTFLVAFLFNVFVKIFQFFSLSCAGGHLERTPRSLGLGFRVYLERTPRGLGLGFSVRV